MEKAGFNPILAAGGQASSPPGAGFSPENMTEGLMQKAVSSALEIQRLRQDLKESKSRVSVNEAQEKKIQSETNPVERWKGIFDSLTPLWKRYGGMLKWTARDLATPFMGPQTDYTHAPQWAKDMELKRIKGKK